MGKNRRAIHTGEKTKTIKDPILLIDANNMGHRALHTTGPLAYKGQPTGVIFGMFMQMFHLLRMFHPSNVVFCWDSRKSIRRDRVATYKANRRQKEPDQELLDAFTQFEKLREEILPVIGFHNNFQQEGYEADDLIAQLTHDYSGQCIICSSDDDLLQLLDHAPIYSLGKKRIIKRAEFEETWGLPPSKWALVKTLAGCTSDNVIGIPGIGEKTAAAYIKGDLKETSKKFQHIQTFPEERFQENKWLVSLPLPGTKPLVIQKNTFNQDTFERICNQFGFRNLWGKEDWYIYLT